jgi:hypothetical protein
MRGSHQSHLCLKVCNRCKKNIRWYYGLLVDENIFQIELDVGDEFHFMRIHDREVKWARNQARLHYAAVKIQRRWRNATANPKFLLCRRRLTSLF